MIHEFYEFYFNFVFNVKKTLGRNNKNAIE